jgi:carbamoyl-phosphate synthase small subunit
MLQCTDIKSICIVGTNYSVTDMQTDNVESTNQSHDFMLRLNNKPAFSVQYHPEASPGPHDSHYLFKRFIDMITAHKAARRAA